MRITISSSNVTFNGGALAIGVDADVPADADDAQVKKIVERALELSKIVAETQNEIAMGLLTPREREAVERAMKAQLEQPRPL